ncbi:MAG: carbohydrate ABC transporter permease [Anaerolineae bacterium]
MANVADSFFKEPKRSGSVLTKRMREFLMTVLVTTLGLVVLAVFLLPLFYMLAGAFKLDEQLSGQSSPLWPAKQATYSYNGQDLLLYDVPTAEGTTRLAMVKPFRESSNMMDPANPGKGVFEVQGRWRTWSAVWNFTIYWDNIVGAWDQVNFPLLYRNTVALAVIGTFGDLLSCIAVAYAFARFRLPGKNILFLILMSTIVLPPQAFIIPLYIIFAKLGWTGTWLPLLVPTFFANAYDVFLLRQYFMTIPRELDEAAMIDGASPFRILVSVIIPQAIPAITAVTLFHFFYEWNNYFTPLVYLVGKEDLYPISVGIAKFVNTFGIHPGLAMATAVMTLLLPLVIFFFAQRQFMQGVVVTGVEK